MVNVKMTKEAFYALGDIREGLGNSATFSDAILYLIEIYQQAADQNLVML